MSPPPDDSGFGRTGETFFSTITAAVNDIVTNGYDSIERIEGWVRKIREAAIRTLTPPHVLERTLNDTMRAIFHSKIERGGILKLHPGVERFTLARVAPRLRGELDRRIMASAGLIKANRQEAVETTLRRFSGWATSIPAGGTDVADRVKAKERIRKPLASLPFETRRVLIDQSAKLTSSLSEILAVDTGALAGHWVSHFNQKNYAFRETHKHYDVDDKLFVVRDNWAMRAGLMKVDGYRYTDEIERPAEKPFCRCYYRWMYSLSKLPEGMLTAKGRAELAKAKVAA